MGSGINFNTAVNNSGNVPGMKTGLLADRPAIASNGFIYIATDSTPRKQYQYDITLAAWIEIGGGGSIGGAVTAPFLVRATANNTLGDSSVTNQPIPSYPGNQTFAFYTNNETLLPATVANGDFAGYVARKESNNKVLAFGLGRENVMGEIFQIYNDENLLFKSFNGTVNSRSVLFSNGRWSINKTTDEGFQFDVNGNLRASQFFTNDVNVIINGGNTFSGRFIPPGQNAVVIGAFSMINATNPGSTIAIGYGNGMTITTGAYNTFIGRNAGRGMTTGEYNLLITQGDNVNVPNLVDCLHFMPHGYEGGDAARCVGTELSRHVLIGGGFNEATYTQKMFLGGGIFVTRPDLAHFGIYAPSGVGANLVGSNLTLNAGRGTGAGTPGDLKFSTASITAPGSSTQAYTDRWLIKGDSGVLTNDNTAPNSSCLIDLVSTQKALGLPAMTTAQKLGIATPRAGMLVYDTTLAALSYYNGAAWV